VPPQLAAAGDAPAFGWRKSNI